MYTAIIGDIISSRKITNRFAMQEKLNLILKAINEEYDNKIAANFIITLGDEFQGLLKNTSCLFEIITKIEIKMKPYKIRFGIGIGEINTKVNKLGAIGADGPAWWKAREMINKIKENEKGLKLIANIKIEGLKNKVILDLININLSLYFSIKSNWTKEQENVVDYIILNYGLTDEFVQKQIAQQLNITPVSLNKKLKRSLYYDLHQSLKTIEKLLESEDY